MGTDTLQGGDGHFTRGGRTLYKGGRHFTRGDRHVNRGDGHFTRGTDTLQGGRTLYRGDGPYAMGWVSDVMQRLENGHYTRGERTLYKGGRTLKLGVPQFLRGVEIFFFIFRNQSQVQLQRKI